MKPWFVLSAAMLLFASLPFSALAAESDVKQEVSTAHAHALMAAGADSLKMTHAHLQHVINCLVGPDGAAFDASAANPCKGQGAGALPDTQGESSLQGQLEEALAAAQSGVKTSSLESAQEAANGAAQFLSTADQKL